MNSKSQPNNMTPLDQIRESFLSFFENKEHARVASSSLVPQDPTVLFTLAGMLQFKPYFVGLETAPYLRAVTSQKCVRAGGKHNDLDDIGRTNRHFTFFEMLGNFSFGDYFKETAIEYAWEYITQVLEFEKEKLWVTVHDSDDEAEELWLKLTDIPKERIQRLDEDNYWKMGDVGPNGPCTEIFYDLGEEFGEDGGPKFGSEDRFVEFWNLVFMQFEDKADGSKVALPKPCVDTGMGIERVLFIKEKVQNIWASSLFMPMIEICEGLTSAKYGQDYETDVSLRIMAEHARTMAFLISDGVMPSNEDRGYVLRRIMRRAVRHAYILGAKKVVMPTIVESVISIMEKAYPELRENADRILLIVENEEVRFRETLEKGLNRLDAILEDGDVSGNEAFFLHDTLGFPIDLTKEIAQIAKRNVDIKGFENELSKQSDRSRMNRKDNTVKTSDASDIFKSILDKNGPTKFLGRDFESIQDSKILVLLNEDAEQVEELTKGQNGQVILDKTTFYAESGGQVGDKGILFADDLEVQVTDTSYAIAPSLIIHDVKVINGTLKENDILTAQFDVVRRNRIKRNHTATHILHWALRLVVGDHVKQAGSYVDDQRLRFDFQHFEQLSKEELSEIERLANEQLISGVNVTHIEMPIEEAKKLGAIAFFGDKYGEKVRVLTAGPSIEFCGGTHVDNLGFIGSIRIVSEGSIGSNIRRIEALTGDRAYQSYVEDQNKLKSLADSLKSTVPELPQKIHSMTDQIKMLNGEVKSMRSEYLSSLSKTYSKDINEKYFVFRHDNMSPDDLRNLASGILAEVNPLIVCSVGLNKDKNKAGLCVAVSKDLIESGINASEIASNGVKLLGGGTAKNAGLALGGGQNIEKIDEALIALEQNCKDALSKID